MFIEPIAIIVNAVQIIGCICLRNMIIIDSAVMRGIMQVLQILGIVMTILYILIEKDERQKTIKRKLLEEGNSILIVGLTLVLCYNWYYLPNCRIVGLYGMIIILILLIWQKIKGLKREVNNVFLIILNGIFIIFALSKNMPKLL